MHNHWHVTWRELIAAISLTIAITADHAGLFARFVFVAGSIACLLLAMDYRMTDRETHSVTVKKMDEL